MITLELKWRVPENAASKFEDAIAAVFIPAVSRQSGFVAYTFLREFGDAALDAMGVERDPHGYRLNLMFESEEMRQRWATTPEHDHAVATALEAATELVACGFDVASASSGPEVRTESNRSSFVGSNDPSAQ